MGNGETQDKVFISHSSADKDWVESLARNLKAFGHAVWLDAWDLIAGEGWIRGLHDGLEQATAGVLVVTPEAKASGWVQEEFGVMMRRKKRSDGFKFIPVLLDDGNDIPFLDNIQCVDFRDPGRYRQAFHALHAGLMGAPPGPGDGSNGRLELPPTGQEPPLQASAEAFITDLFDELEFDHLCMVLAQDGMTSGPIGRKIMDQAIDRYGAENVRQIMPPVTEDSEVEAYLASVARQCGVEIAGGNAEDLEWALFEQLPPGRPGLFVVGEFENGTAEARSRLATLLRRLYEKDERRVRVLFRGGEGLADLKYRLGSHSILNVVREFRWPELTLADVVALAEQRFPDDTMESEAAETILRASGGEPRLVRSCLRLHHRAPKRDEASYSSELKASGETWQFFTQVLRDPAFVEQIKGWLDDRVVSSWQPYISDDVARRLYWRNLLAKREVSGKPRLCWRCDAIREAGREVLACG